ncbi:hypothetical protein CIB48_g9862 [Xylaria polymorpha]|nr:hypothetical protein CIB48_g9862 [Xylaria polymorpha]
MEDTRRNPPLPTDKSPQPLRRSPRLNSSPEESTRSSSIGFQENQSSSGNSACSSACVNSGPYSNTIVKVYNDHQLYSIFDRGTKKYIYHSKLDGYKEHTVSFSNDGYCDAVYDAKGRKVYEKSRGSR